MYLRARSAVLLTQPEVEWVGEVVLVFSLLHSSLVRWFFKNQFTIHSKNFGGARGIGKLALDSIHFVVPFPS